LTHISGNWDDAQQIAVNGGAVTGSYVAKVKGTYGTLPRGYPWVLLVPYAVMGTIFATIEVHSWIGTAGGILIFASGAVTVAILRNMKTPTFIVNTGGIRLGGRRHRVDIPWQEIREVRISSAAHGAQVDVVLATPPPARHRLPLMAEVLLGFVPYSHRFLVPPLLAPVTNPAGYHAPLWGTTADHVAEGIKSLAPDWVSILR
jgi:hypothetical protein